MAGDDHLKRRVAKYTAALATGNDEEKVSD
jgi:hypothetical protein